MRPDTSQRQGNGASRHGLSLVAAQLAVHDGPGPGRESRLGVALARMAQELAAARREITALKRENAALRSKRGKIQG